MDAINKPLSCFLMHYETVHELLHGYNRKQSLKYDKTA